MMTWICGFRLRSLPKVCITDMKPGKHLYLFIITSTIVALAASNNTLRIQSSRKRSRKGLSSSGNVNVIWIYLIWCGIRLLVDSVRLSQAVLPQDVHNLLWQTRHTFLVWEQLSQASVMNHNSSVLHFWDLSTDILNRSRTSNFCFSVSNKKNDIYSFNSLLSFGHHFFCVRYSMLLLGLMVNINNSI
jgi:hypothetical protein